MSQIKLDAKMIETILDKVVPLIAEPNDYGFFRGVIGLQLEEMNSAQASVFINNLLTHKE